MSKTTEISTSMNTLYMSSTELLNTTTNTTVSLPVTTDISVTMNVTDVTSTIMTMATEPLTPSTTPLTIGIAVGTAGFILVIICVIAVVCFRRRHQSKADLLRVRTTSKRIDKQEQIKSTKLPNIDDSNRCHGIEMSGINLCEGGMFSNTEVNNYSVIDSKDTRFSLSPKEKHDSVINPQGTRVNRPPEKNNVCAVDREETRLHLSPEQNSDSVLVLIKTGCKQSHWNYYCSNITLSTFKS